MTRVRFAIVLCLAAFAADGMAQTPTPGPPPSPAIPAAPPRAPRSESAQDPERPVGGQPVNVRFDITIIDEGGPLPSRKTVSLTTADRQSGQVRANVSVPSIGDVPLAVDAFPILERDGKIRARITLDYRPNPGNDPKQAPAITTSMRLSFGILLNSGTKLVAAQAADPVTDRRVTVEVTATVLR